jgi:CRISPR/Cas system endoribonuclease Cas6 (RAMP superfamily)
VYLVGIIQFLADGIDNFVELIAYLLQFGESCGILSLCRLS